MIIRSFVTNYDGMANVLKNQVGITDPAQTRMIGIEPKVDLEITAIWDTGATNSAITASLASKLKLIPTGLTRVNHGGGIETRSTYLVDVWLPNKVTFPGVQVTELDIRGAEVLIGMDIIGAGDFAVSNFEEKTTFTFRVPSSEKTDYTKMKVIPIKSATKPKKGKGKNKGRFKF